MLGFVWKNLAKERKKLRAAYLCFRSCRFVTYKEHVIF